MTTITCLFTAMAFDLSAAYAAALIYTLGKRLLNRPPSIYKQAATIMNHPDRYLWRHRYRR